MRGGSTLRSFERLDIDNPHTTEDVPCSCSATLPTQS